jgi:hypothetical protein
VDKERHFLAPIAHGPSRPSVVVGGTDAVTMKSSSSSSSALWTDDEPPEVVVFCPRCAARVFRGG